MATMSFHPFDFSSTTSLEEKQGQWEFIQSRIHRKERMQVFAGKLEIKDFMGALRIVKGKPFCILGAIDVTAQTNFGEQFPQPHPKINLEALLFWNSPTINFGIKLKKAEFARPNVRYCVETFVSKDLYENSKWASLGYFGSQAQLILMEGSPVVLWTWFLDGTNYNLSLLDGKPVGNLLDFLEDGNLTIRVSLLAMSALNTMARVRQDELSFRMRPKYVELKADRCLGMSTMLYQEFSQYYDLRIHSIDRKSFFLVDSCVLTSQSETLLSSFKEHYELGHRGCHICSLEVDLVTTNALRAIIFYSTRFEVYKGWTDYGVEVLLGGIHLGTTDAVRDHVNNLKREHKITPSGMTAIWMKVHDYFLAVKPQVEAFKKSLHQRLHPGEPCGPYCKPNNK